MSTVLDHAAITRPENWKFSENFRVRCRDGRIRTVARRCACGWTTSGDPGTRKLWWHDLVDWSRVGIGTALRAWALAERCNYRAPNGHQCALPVGHVSYLRIGHRTGRRQQFVVKMHPEWPS